MENPAPEVTPPPTAQTAPTVAPVAPATELPLGAVPTDTLPALPQRTRRQTTILGGEIFAAGALLASLMYLTAKILIDVHTLNLPLVLMASYVSAPLSGALGAVLAFRVHRFALNRKVPEISPWVWIALFFVFGWVNLVLFFTHFMHQRVLERGERWVKFAILYFLAAVGICIFGATTRTDWVAAVSVLTAAGAMCFCCNTLLINVVQTLASRKQLAPLPSENFQFSLGSLFIVVFCSAAWVTGLVAMLKRH